ncbi:MAG: YbhB/YbcL family Raf kinase inhibitor-like protein [Sandaracinaceae bacterium]|jgi:Raf kinase inhibitor-like YbhB/YbcL family protein|nr:YbhB/YbcL family Raf kinase inhibitor-like protein [Sandaracinaceae bacterium]
MNRSLAFQVLTLCVAASLVGCAHDHESCAHAHTTPNAAVANGFPLADPITAPASLTVRSADFAEGGAIPLTHVFSGMGCGGGNESPALAWSGAPEGTQSYAIVVHDPDAPTGVGFFHWSVFDLPAATTSLARNAAASPPAGAVMGRTDFGTNTYGGPCPPPGAPHRYAFTVYALDVPSLGVDATASGALLRFMLAQHTLAYGRLVGTYQRSESP